MKRREDSCLNCVCRWYGLEGDDPGEMKALQEYLTTKFKMKVLGQLKYSWELRLPNQKTIFPFPNEIIF